MGIEPVLVIVVPHQQIARNGLSDRDDRLPGGEVVHTRAATGTERQMLIPGDELPPDKPKKGKGGKGTRAPGAVQ